MKATLPLDSSLLELLGDLNREYCAILDAEFNFLYLNRSYRNLMESMGYNPKRGLSLLDLFNNDTEGHSRIWLDAFKKLNPAHLQYQFSTIDHWPKQETRIDAEVQMVSESGEVKYYAIGFDELSDTFLEHRFNQLKIEFLAKAIKVQDVDELMWVVVDELLSKLYLPDAMILLRKGNVLVPVAAHGNQRIGKREVAVGIKVPFSAGITGYVATSAVSYMTADSRTDPRYIQQHFEAGSEVAVPIMVRGKVFGVIDCESDKLNYFRPIHQDLLERTAEVLSVRIEEMTSREELSQLEQRHLAIINSTPNSFLLFNDKFELMSCNSAAYRAWRRFTGVNIKEGRSFRSLIPKDFSEPFKQMAAKALNGSHSEEYLSWKHRNRDFQLKINFAPAKDREGQIFGLTMLVEDVSALYNANRALRTQNSNLEKSNKELDQFVYSISHDLRAPLSSIMGLVNLIENSQQLPETKLYGKMLLDATESMDSYIRNTLEYSRNKRFVIEEEEIDLEDLIREMEQKFRFIPGYRELKFSKEFEVSTIKSDSYRIEIILNNLISNAIKYRDVSKSESWVKLKVSSRENHWELSVSDNGLGVPKAKQAYLFDMFFKVKSEHPGSGLGLYILKEVMDNLNGEIIVDSKEKKGSTFTLLLPKKR